MLLTLLKVNSGYDKSFFYSNLITSLILKGENQSQIS